MPELPGPPVRPQLAKPPGCARLLLDHIRWGRELVRRFETGWDDEANDACRVWQDRSRQLLRFLLVADELYEHMRAVYARMCLRHALRATDQREDLKTDLRELESVARELGLRAGVLPPDAARLGSAPGADAKVLVVHGRNREVKEQVARFLMKLGLEPILLDEQPALGRTLIEKLEAQAGIAFAVVILTGDDVGGLTARPRALRPRARQNVIFELGFSVANLTRERVCALYQEGVELPSDIHGVEYTALDPAGAWRAKLGRELYEAGLRFDPLKVLA
jgi:predicted nucleotide-binding protein